MYTRRAIVFVLVLVSTILAHNICSLNVFLITSVSNLLYILYLTRKKKRVKEKRTARSISQIKISCQVHKSIHLQLICKIYFLEV